MLLDKDFPPEYKKALDVLIKVLNREVSAFIRFDVPEEIMNKDTVVFLEKNFNSKDIPSGCCWRWNQVKSRKFVWLNVETFVEFFKLMPRPTKPGPKVKPYKLWRYNVYEQRKYEGKTILYRILWCERGIENEQIEIDDLKFLASFMDPMVANEIWPRK